MAKPPATQASLTAQDHIVVEVHQGKSLDARHWAAAVICGGLLLLAGELVAHVYFDSWILSDPPKFRDIKLPVNSGGFYVLLVGAGLMLLAQLIVSWASKPTVIVKD